MMTVAEFLEWESKQQEKYEFFNGTIYAMAGGTITHSRIASRLFAWATHSLAGSGCEVHGGMLKVTAASASFFPDVVVFCGEPVVEGSDEQAITNPTVVFEVLSPSTERFDRTRKVAAYTSCPSLKSCVLVSAEEPIVEVLSRNEAGNWEWRQYTGLDAVADIPGIGSPCPLSPIYQGLEIQETQGPFIVKVQP